MHLSLDHAPLDFSKNRNRTIQSLVFFKHSQDRTTVPMFLCGPPCGPPQFHNYAKTFLFRPYKLKPLRIVYILHKLYINYIIFYIVLFVGPQDRTGPSGLAVLAEVYAPQLGSCRRNLNITRLCRVCSHDVIYCHPHNKEIIHILVFAYGTGSTVFVFLLSISDQNRFYHVPASGSALREGPNISVSYTSIPIITQCGASQLQYSAISHVYDRNSKLESHSSTPIT